MTTCTPATASRGGNIESVLPLSPIQQGMLFHCLEDRQSGLYVEQYICLVKGPLQPDRFRAAWNDTVAAHAALRALFVWDKAEKPVQIIRQRVQIPWRFLDWTQVDPEQRAVRFETLVSADHAQGFSLDQAPLMRITVIKLDDQNHRMLWTNHHLLMDGWSTPRVLNEMLGRYQARAAGQSREHPPSAPLAPYLNWVLSQDLTVAEPYWRRTLSGFRQPNELLPPVSRQTHVDNGVSNHGQTYLTLSADTTAILGRFAREHKLTTSTLFYSAWAALVGVYSQRHDVVFGMTVSGRSSGPEGIDRVVGLFLNTIPLRVTLDPQQRILDWLRQVQNQQLEAMAFEQTPLTDIQSWSDVPAGQGLFDSLAVFENYPDSGATLGASNEVRIDNIEYREHTNYPVSAIAIPGEELRLLIIHDRTRLDSAAAARMVEQLSVILSRLPAHADDPLSFLDPLPAEEREQLLQMSVSPWPRQPHSADILDRIRTNGDLHAGDTAVVCGNQRLNYRQLVAGASALAARLRAQGIGPNRYLGICVERGVELPMATIGVLMSGAAYVPLDPGYPRDRLSMVLSEVARSDGGAATLITQRALSTADLAPDATVIYIDDPAGDPAPLDKPESTPDDPAYAIFTSGSTGKPKGVVVSRANLLASTEARSGYYAGRPPGCFLLTSSFAFDSAIAGLYWTLTTAGRLVLLPPNTAPDITLLSDLIEREGVTHTLMLPSLYRLLLENTQPERLHSLTTIIVAGEPCPAAVVALHKKRLPKAELHNEYGPTETTVWCTAERLDSGPSDTPPTIGRPIPGARVYVVDASLQLLPIGVPGEIAVAGAGVAAGYLNSAKDSAERFVSEPFATRERLYLTGDRGYIGEDGRIRCLGRNDEQIKIRGHRVEPTEIESLLRTHPDVADAAVVLADGSALVGFVETPVQQGLDTKALSRWLTEILPAHMVPGRWRTLTALPTTVTGKLDRRALSLLAEKDKPQRVRSGSGSASDTKPCSEKEQILVKILAQVLKLDRVGVEDNFFELGGDSIKSIQIAAEARRRGLSISAHDLFAHQTAAALAVVAEQETKAVGLGTTGPRRAPLSPIQIWFHEQKLTESHHWNQSFTVDVDPALSRTTIESALRTLVARHDALRVRFRISSDNVGEQQLLDNVVPKVLGFDLTRVTPELRASAEDEAIRTLQGQLNPRRGLVVAAAAFDLGTPQARLVLCAHHLCVDVLSWPLLLRDLDRLLENPRPASQRQLPGSFLCRAAALSREASNPRTTNELAYWLQQSTDLDTALPVDFVEGADDEESGRSLVLSVAAEEAPVLKSHTGSPAILLLGALARTLARWTLRTSVTVLMEGHGREPIDGANDPDTTVGWFTSLFPLRIDLNDLNIDANQALESANKAWRAVPRGGLGYGLLRYLAPAAEIRAQLAASQEPSVLFNYLGWVGDDNNLGQLVRSARHCPTGERSGCNHRPHLLEVSAWSEQGGLRINWRYSANRHRESTITKLAGVMQETLMDLGETPTTAKQTSMLDLGEDLGLSDQDLNDLLTQLPD